MSFYLSASQGYANWYYSHYFTDSSSDVNGSNEVTLRGCNFFEAIGCALLALVVGTIIAAGVAALILLATFKVIINGVVQNVNTKSQEDLAFIAALAGFIFTGVNVYEWCCGRDDVPEQICEGPTGAAYIQTGCNEFVYRVFGPSDYGLTVWDNDNTDPAEATTPNPRLKLSVPSFGDPSVLIARIACLIDGSTVEIFDWKEDETFELDDNPFPLVWEDAPPTNATYIPNFTLPYFISVNTSSTDIFTYTWSITSPHTIDGGVHDSNAKIKFNSSGLATTTVIVLDNCTGISESISGQTQIQ
ncbi:MAG: hypothetical protein ACI86M_003188 [Saprospiraceae bacterium]|jgi:hypothetical protein